MRRVLTIVAASVCIAAPAFADVTITSKVSGKGVAQVADGQTVTYIKGLKMRVDSTTGGNRTSVVFDLEGQKMLAIDHGRKQVETVAMDKLRQDLEKVTQGGTPTATLTPNGRTEQIAGQTATGYDVKATMPMAMGSDQKMTIVMSGPVFVVKGAPGTEDYARFYRAAAERGFVLTNPAAAKSAPQQGRGMTEMFGKLAETGGIPYRMEVSMKVEGGGPMADMMNKMMANASFVQEVIAVATDAIPADRFEVPAGYTVKN